MFKSQPCITHKYGYRNLKEKRLPVGEMVETEIKSSFMQVCAAGIRVQEDMMESVILDHLTI